MDSEERIEALHEISSDNDNYVKLSDGTKIGENLLTDLNRYFLLKIKLKNNENYSKNILNEVEKIKVKNIIEKISIIFKSYNLDDKIDVIKRLLSGNIIKDNIKNINKFIEKYNINTNRLIDDTKKCLDDIIVELKKNKEYSFLEPTQLIETKKDIIKLENIFKNKTYSSFDNIVLLDKFNIFKQKYKRLKEDLRQEDDELINVMIEDIISKLKITYGIYDTNKIETTKITNEIYKKIGINRQAILEEADKQKKEADKKKEAQEKEAREKEAREKENEASINYYLIYDFVRLIKSNSVDDYYYNINNFMFQNKLIIIANIEIIITKYFNYYHYNKNKYYNDNKNEYEKAFIDFNNDFSKDYYVFEFINIIIENYIILAKNDIYLYYNNQSKISEEIYNKLSSRYTTSTSISIGGFEGKSNNQDEKVDPMLLDHYNNIKDIYIKLIISYYILIGKIGGEENEIKIINNEDEDKHDDIIKDINIEINKNKEGKELTGEKMNNTGINANKINDDIQLLIKYRDIESSENKKIKKNNDRIKVLNDELKNITESLFELYIVCNKIKQIPLMTEYEENIHNILITNNIYLFKDKNDKKRHLSHYIITDINKELSRLIKENEDSAQEIIKIKKNIADSQKNDRFNNGQNNGYNNNRNYHNSRFYNGGDGDNTEPITNYTKLRDFLRLKKVGNDNNNNNQDLKDLVYQLKEDSNYNYYDNNGMNINNYNDNGEDKTIYENIWNQYMTGTHKPSKKNPLKNIEQGEILYNNVNEHNLVPEIVLGVNFQDKAIFVFLILIIRTIVMVFFELIIEYNLVKSLQYSIIIYSIIYLVLLVLSIGLVNYDSYKLRIVFNYLNVHINSSNLILHIILFIIFVSLIMIMIDSDDLIHNVGYLFDYTKIYVHIYENTMTQDKEIFYNILTRDEKIKLLYRLEIISMIIFIFSSFIILLL